jgi:hypothetical protein
MVCSGDSLDRFLHALRRSWDIGQSLVNTLLDWESVHGFASCATWTKRAVKIDGLPFAVPLVFALGEAFRGNAVGHVGRDMIEAFLHDDRRDVREAAMTVVEAWAGDDSEGPWGALLDDALAREGLCPDCGADDCLCDVNDFDDFAAAEETEDNWEDPALEDWRASVRCREARIHITASTRVLPSILERTCSLSLSTTLSMIESVRTGHVCMPDGNLRIVLSQLCGGAGHVIRIWNDRVCVSLEPTGEDRWLVFAYC